MRAGRKKRKTLLKWVAITGVIAVGLVFLVGRKEAFERQAVDLLSSVLSREADLSVSVGRVRSRFLSAVSFEDVRVVDRRAGESPENVFSAKTIEVHYDLSRLLSKDAGSKTEVRIESPVIVWRPHLGARRPAFPFFSWFRRWAVSQRRSLSIRVENLEINFGGCGRKIGGVDAKLEDDRLTVELPARHLELAGLDVSTTLRVEAQFQPGIFGREDRLAGKISTGGTVINWNPLEKEALFEFVLSNNEFHLVRAEGLGGIEASGVLDFFNDYELDFLVRAEKFSAAQARPFLNASQKNFLPRAVDLDLSFKGNFWSPQLEGKVRLHDGWTGKNKFKMMDMNLSGVLPTLSLAGSRVLLEDGSSMRFANRTVEVRELLDRRTLEALVSEAQQESVVWGGWEFKRPVNEQGEEKFLMQRSLSDHASVHLKQVDEEEPSQEQDAERLEVGFEYHLRSKDSLKLEFREEERFVGVERKMRF